MTLIVVYPEEGRARKARDGREGEKVKESVGMNDDWPSALFGDQRLSFVICPFLSCFPSSRAICLG